MKKLPILTVVFISISFFLYGQDSYKQNLESFATINFPSKPDFVDTLGQKAYKYSDEDAIYYILIFDSSMQKDFQLNEGRLDEFYNGYVNGVIKASNGKLVSKNMFDINGVRGVEIEYNSISNPNLPDLGFQKVLFFNRTIITVNFLTLSKNKLSTQNKRNKYFDSFVVTIDKEKIKQFTVSIDQIDKSGYIMGTIIFYFILIWLIIRMFQIVKNGKKYLRHIKQ